MGRLSDEMRAASEALLANSEVLERALGDQALALREFASAAERDGWVEQVASASNLAQEVDSHALKVSRTRSQLITLLRIDSGQSGASN